MQARESLNALSNAADGEPFDLEPLLPFLSPLRADAERYRYLRDNGLLDITEAEIDAARKG